ncbi:MAG: hypothetical protein MJZ96_07715 [Paludibacteraceae bacterium]|nr:hypothetical protein [Paludibacteraceae bacterium]
MNMKRSVFVNFALICLVIMCVSCKVHEPLAKDATFYQWRTNQLSTQLYTEDYFRAYSGANFIYTGESLFRDTVCTYIEQFSRELDDGTIDWFDTYSESKWIHDIYMKDGHTYITGMITKDKTKYNEDDWNGFAYSKVESEETRFAFLEIDGVIKDITPKDPRVKNPNNCCGLHFISDGKKLYTIIRGESETKELPQGSCGYTDYYVSEDGGEPYYIGSFEQFAVGEIAKVGDEWYVCGRWSTSACYQSSTETKTFIAPLERGGMLNGIVDYHGEPLMVGRMGGYPITFYHDTISKLPGHDTWVNGDAIFAKMINGDLYIGGELRDHPAIWKNNELLVLIKELPKGFNDLFFTDIEVVGDMIYVVGEGDYKENDTYHSAFFKLKNTGDLIQEYDEYEDLITSVEVMKWIGNTTWQNVTWETTQGVFAGWNINKPRVLLKY